MAKGYLVNKIHKKQSQQKHLMQKKIEFNAIFDWLLYLVQIIIIFFFHMTGFSPWASSFRPCNLSSQYTIHLCEKQTTF